jgi:hypothetical protein
MNRAGGVEHVDFPGAIVEPATGKIGDPNPTGGGEGDDKKRDLLVANAPGRMLVDETGGVDGGAIPIEDPPRIPHSQREVRDFRDRHASKVDCHRKGADLSLRDSAAGRAIDEEPDLARRESEAVTFLSDYILRK